jgi:hypothetical protein
MIWQKRTVSFIFTDEAAANGDVKYFCEKYRRAVAEKNWQDRAVLVARALQGTAAVAAWAAEQPVGELMLTHNAAMLRTCVRSLCGGNGGLQIGVLLAEPEMAAHVLRWVVNNSREFRTVERQACEKGYYFGRKDCLAHGGVVLHFARRSRRRWLAKKYALTPSDFASAGVPWP